MRVFKWLKRDRNGRRSSDTPAIGVRDADDSSLPLDCYSSIDSINKTDDPIRTDEYKRALAEFFARRSLGAYTPPNSATGEKGKGSSDKSKKSRSTPKRRSLPDGRRTNRPELITRGPPQINFLFSNRIYLPNGADAKSDAIGKERKRLEVCDSPDLLQGNNGRDRQVDFDIAEDRATQANSPPPEFYKDNSLPYEDRNSYMANATDRSRPFCERSLGDLAENDDDEREDDGAAEISIDSIARKLEKMCRETAGGRFRGVPLVRRSDLRTASASAIESSEEGELREKSERSGVVSWGGARVTLKLTADSEIDLLTTIRHPNILLMMGLCYDCDRKVHSIFEETVVSLHDLIHNQGSIVSLPTSVGYLKDISKAVSYLQIHRYVHTSISSHCILITSKDIAKLTDFEFSSKISISSSIPLGGGTTTRNGNFNQHNNRDPAPEPDYVNVYDLASDDTLSEHEPLLTAGSYREGFNRECLPQDNSQRETNVNYRFQAPELFENINGFVYPSRRSDVYSICIILWECCNNAVPWSTLSYEQLRDLYLLWQTGIRLPQDGRYPQTVYDILSGGLALNILDRITVDVLCEKLEIAKKYLDDFDEETLLRKNLENRFKSLRRETEESSFSSKRSSVRNRTRSNEKSKADESSENVVRQVSAVANNINKYRVTDIDGDPRLSENDSSMNYSIESRIENAFSQKPYCDDEISHPGQSTSDIMIHSNSLLEFSSAQNTTMNKTDSTEYHGLLTPDVTRYTSRLNNLDSSDLISKLSFNEDSNDPSPMTREKVVRLNASLTPKSYKSLHIKSPPVEDIESIRTLTRTFNKRINDRKKSKYSFEIKNSSLPNTPIARSTKIRKIAWLSGAYEDDDDLRYNETKAKFNDLSQKDFNQSKISDSQGVDLSDCTKELSNITTGVPPDISGDKSCLSAEKKGTIGHKRNITFCGDLSQLSSDRDSSTKSPGSNKSNQISKGKTNLSRFRSRSQSWSSKPADLECCENPDEVTGVDIKPLVAIHERWIQEARQKFGRSHSLPNAYRCSPHAIKPASHRVDSVLNAKSTIPSQSFIPAKQTMTSPQLGKRKSPKKHQLLPKTPSAVRVAVSRSQMLNSRPADFFENSLWKKEKDKCMSFMKNGGDPQCSSTPYRPKADSQFSPTFKNTDQSTNTETFQELCDRIIDQFKSSVKQPILPSENLKNNNTFTKDRSIKNIRISDPIINELTEVFQRIERSNSMKDDKHIVENKNKINEAISASEIRCVVKDAPDVSLLNRKTSIDGHRPLNRPLLSEIEKNFYLSTKNNNDGLNEDYMRNNFKDFHAVDPEEDCSSLPYSVNSDDTTHKSLKRCQAFSALQDARSTEDMYIDDELSAHVDMQALSDNMQLIPLHGSLHEALCDKERNCCLVKIQEEARCDRVFIICDNSNPNVTLNLCDLGDPSSDDEIDHTKQLKNNRSDLKIESLPGVDPAELRSQSIGLDVIEERSGEEEGGRNSSFDDDPPDSMKSIRDLIHIYEGETLRSSTVDNKFNNYKKISSRPPEDEISIFIMDDGEDFDYHSEQLSGRNDDIAINGSLADDIIHV